MNSNLIRNIHLVEFVDGTDAVVSEHEGAGFDGEFAGFFIFDDSGGETSCGGGFSGGVNGAGEEGADVSGKMSELRAGKYRERKGHLLEKLRFASTGISHDTDVQVTPELHTFGGNFADTTHQLQE